MKYVIIRKFGPFWARRVERREFNSLEELDRGISQLRNHPNFAFAHSDEYKIIIKRLGRKADELLEEMSE